jgi:hypothetical protein
MSSFLSITPTLALSPDTDSSSAIRMDVDSDLRDSEPTPHCPRSPSPQSLSSSSEPFRRLQPLPMNRVESPSPTRQTSSVLRPLPDAEPPPPPGPSSPRPVASPPPPPSLQATPKVKISLKDFAMRKKQREEEQARAAVGPDSLHPCGQSRTSAASDPPSSDAGRDPDGCE